MKKAGLFGALFDGKNTKIPPISTEFGLGRCVSLDEDYRPARRS